MSATCPTESSSAGSVWIEEKAAQKTPITLLQEMCSKKGITPQYELLSSEGYSQDSAFVFRAMVSADLQATAAGKSKKLAKHMAAKALLERIISSTRAAEFPLPGKLSYLTSADAIDYIRKLLPEAEKLQKTEVPLNDEALDMGSGNPIGKLQELTMSKRWPPPTYEDVRIEGKPNNCWFVVSCRLGEFMQKGESRTKRNAKKVAAEKMFNFLTRSHSGSNDGPEHDEDELTQSAVPGGLNKASLPPSSVLGPTSIENVSRNAVFFTNLQAQPSITLRKLWESSIGELPEVSTEKLLEIIAKDHHFSIRFHPLKGLTSEGRYQCLVQLDSNPVAVCYGTGLTMDVARCTAARNALEYLKITTDPKGFAESL